MAKRLCLNEVCLHRAPQAQASLQLSSPDPLAIMVLFIVGTRYRPTIRTGYVGLNVLDMEITNMFQSKKLSTRTRPRKVVTATTYFPVVATPGGWDLAKLRADLGS